MHTLLPLRALSPFPPPSLSRRLQGISSSCWRNANLLQTHLLNALQNPPLFLILLLTTSSSQFGQNIVPISELLPVRFFILLTLPSLRVRLNKYVQQGCNGSVRPGRAHGSATRGASIWVERSGGGGLKNEPFLEASTAEGMQAIEEGEGLVQEIGTYLAERMTGQSRDIVR